MTKWEYNEIEKNLLSFACAFLTCRRKSYHHPEFRADKTFVQKNQPRPLQADSSCRWLWIIGRGSFWSHNNPLHFQCMHAMEQLCGKVLELGLQSVQKHLNNITSRAQNGLSDVQIVKNTSSVFLSLFPHHTIKAKTAVCKEKRAMRHPVKAEKYLIPLATTRKRL